MIFKDRLQAGELLTRSVLLEEKRAPTGLATVVVALPRGGVPIAAAVARGLHAQLDILVSKKIGAPHQAEFAIGAVSSGGAVVVNPELNAALLDLPSGYIESEAKRLLQLTRDLENSWRRAAGMKAVPLEGKRVILVDDGVATGMTTLAALKTTKDRGASYVVLAAPVIAKETLNRLRDHCDLAVAVTVPEAMGAIGHFYEDFHQLDDAEVIACLRCAQLMSTQETKA